MITHRLLRDARGRARRRLAGALILVALGLPSTAGALGTVEGEWFSIEAIGALRLTGAYQRFTYEAPPLSPDDDGYAGSVLRLLLQGDLGESSDYMINLFSDIARVPAMILDGSFSSVGSFVSPYRSKYLAWNYWQRGAVQGHLGVDHLCWSLHRRPWDLSIGRMPVTYSVTSIFSPNDFFVPFSATAINKVYKAGVDALRLNYALGSLSALELIGVLGSHPDGVPGWGRSALLLRASTVLWNFEWALLGGKLAKRWVAGASFQGQLGDVGIRGEGHVGFPDANGDGTLDSQREIHGRMALGTDMNFAWQNSAFSLEGLYLTDGAAAPDAYLARALSFYPDDPAYLNQLYLGLSAGGEIIPILRLNALLMLNARDGSGLGSLTLLYSIADEADFVGGLLIPWGEKPMVQSDAPGDMPTVTSEFGLVPITLFMETRFYF